MKKYFLYLIFFATSIVYGENLEIWSESAILIEYETGQILYSKNIHSSLPPASMTKLVTIYKIFSEIKKGSFNLDTRVPISINADWRNLPRDSSLMFIEEGHKVTVKEIIKGLAISSGNDAAIAIAEFISGDMTKFIQSINRDLKRLGFKNLNFKDSSGFSDYNSVTVYEFSQFIKILIDTYPDSLDEIFSIESFTYPKRQNGKGSLGPIKQYNRNKLIGKYPGCDGLKTGFINKSGMNIALTAKREDVRLIAVLIGARDKNKKIADKKREEDAIKILDYGFNNFNKVRLSSINLEPIILNNKTLYPYIPYHSYIFLEESFKTSKYRLNIDNYSGIVEFNSGSSTFSYPIVIKINH